MWLISNFLSYGSDYIQSSTYDEAHEIRLYPNSDPLLVAQYSTTNLNDHNATAQVEGEGTTVNQYYHFLKLVKMQSIFVR